MNKSFIITESERSRILGLHQEATSRQYLKENGSINLKTWKEKAIFQDLS